MPVHCTGIQVQEACEHFVFVEDANKDDPQKAVDKLAEYCSPRFGAWPVMILLTYFLHTSDLKQTCAVLITWRTGCCKIRFYSVFSDRVQELLLHEKMLDQQKALAFVMHMNLPTRRKIRFQIVAEEQTLYETVIFVTWMQENMLPKNSKMGQSAESVVAEIISSQNARKRMQCLQKLSKNEGTWSQRSCQWWHHAVWGKVMTLIIMIILLCAFLCHISFGPLHETK